MSDLKNSAPELSSLDNAQDEGAHALWEQYQGRKLKSTRLKGIAYSFLGILVLLLVFVGLWIVAVR